MADAVTAFQTKERTLLFAWSSSYFRKLYPSVFQLVLDLGGVHRILIRWQRARILRHRPLPLHHSHLQVAGLLVDLSKVIVNRGIRIAPLVRLAQILFSKRVLT